MIVSIVFYLRQNSPSTVFASWGKIDTIRKYHGNKVKSTYAPFLAHSTITVDSSKTITLWGQLVWTCLLHVEFFVGCSLQGCHFVFVDLLVWILFESWRSWRCTTGSASSKDFLWFLSWFLSFSGCCFATEVYDMSYSLTGCDCKDWL